jgi:Ca2+-binding EF-hand superfamily protein
MEDTSRGESSLDLAPSDSRPLFSEDLTASIVLDAAPLEEPQSASIEGETPTPSDGMDLPPSWEGSQFVTRETPANAWSYARALTYKVGFRALDRDNNGFISPWEMGNFLSRSGIKATNEEIHDIISQADLDGNGEIDYEEFTEVMMSAQSRWPATHPARTLTSTLGFRVFDQDGSGFITSSKIREVMAGIGVFLSNQETDEMIKQADVDGNGLLDYEKFTRMIMIAHHSYEENILRKPGHIDYDDIMNEEDTYVDPHKVLHT